MISIIFVTDLGFAKGIALLAWKASKSLTGSLVIKLFLRATSVCCMVDGNSTASGAKILA